MKEAHELKDPTELYYAQPLEVSNKLVYRMERMGISEWNECLIKKHLRYVTKRFFFKSSEPYRTVAYKTANLILPDDQAVRSYKCSLNYCCGQWVNDIAARGFIDNGCILPGWLYKDL